MILVDAARVSASRPGRELFTDLSLTIDSGDRIGVVGINGTGKSTLLRVLSGAEQPEVGSVRFGNGVRIASLHQDPQLEDMAVRRAIGEGWQVEAVLSRLGLDGLMDRSTTALSGGQRKRVALAATLVTTGLMDGAGGTSEDLLFLDEPTNHLDLEAIGWLEDRLAGFRGAIVVVTHDRHLLDRLTNRVLELDRGKVHVHSGGYQSYLESRVEREAYGNQQHRKTVNLAKSELAWLRRGAPARTAKPKARIATATALVNAKAEAPARKGGLELLFAATPRLGNTVVELEGVGHGWDRSDLFSGVDLALDPRERLGVIGPNGVGKSTLLDIIAGRIAPRSGTVVVGATAQIGYYDQQGVALDPNARALDVVAGPTRSPDWRDEALCERFWFDGDTMRSPTRLLSGGERRRLQLVAVLAAAPNVLLLDEPTNDLDLETLRALEEFLEDWPGALLVASHDRAFLERTVADVIVLDGAGFAGRRAGGLTTWIAEFAQRRGEDRKPKGDTRSSTKGRDGVKRSASTLGHLLREADKELGRRQRTVDKLAGQLEAATESGDHGALAKIGTEIAAASVAVTAAEEHWLELAAEAEDS